MSEEFRKPFTAPPAIFGPALLASAIFGLIFPFGGLPTIVQLTAGPLVILCGVLLIRASMREIKIGDTTYSPFKTSTNLMTSGIFRHSRNPGYLGLAVIQLGFSVLLDNIWVVIAALGAVLVTSVFVIRLEEDKLTAAFGQEYLDYKGRVRRWV